MRGRNRMAPARARAVVARTTHADGGRCALRQGRDIPRARRAGAHRKHRSGYRPLDAMLARLPVAQIAWLGDLLHAREAHAALDALVAWRARHADVACTLVRGNHDRHAGDPPAGLHFNVVEEPWPIGPFALCHEPQVVPDCYVIAGHVHPGVVISGRAKDRLRLPCFRFGPTSALLPAFGEFTGLWTAPPEPGEALFAIANDRVWPLPS